MAKQQLIHQMQAAGLGGQAADLAGLVIHGTYVSDREDALRDLLEYLGVLGKVTR